MSTDFCWSGSSRYGLKLKCESMSFAEWLWSVIAPARQLKSIPDMLDTNIAIARISHTSTHMHKSQHIWAQLTEYVMYITSTGSWKMSYNVTMAVIVFKLQPGLVEKRKRNKWSFTLHYIALHYITLHYITLHCTTLHYITIHYITLHYIIIHYNAL